MSDISDFMDFSPTRQSKVAACEKLRDTVHSISAMHSSISEGARTPTKKNSFLELYQMTSFDLAKKRRIDKPIKAVIKGLPNSSITDDITSDLADVGFKIEAVLSLLLKNQKPLPFFS
ncbi:hypothetical protein TNCV_5002061 [Trichonephila clavipes]|nr:hypothetical protein TNCV_5002061 [Trichonephila clavipes]